MSRSVVLRADYRISQITKPFLLIERNHDLSGTDYHTICRLSEEHARLLNAEGIRFLYQMDWDRHYRKIQLLEAERDKQDAERRLAELKGQSHG